MPCSRDRGGRGHAPRRFLQVAVLALALAAVRSTVTLAADRYDPRLRFRTLSTPHFDIHFHQHEEAEARRLAALAEQVAGTLAASLGRPDSRVHVILVDQNDLSNGWATPVPINAIEITAAAPPGDSEVGYTDDWLRLVFTHEYTHVVHLSRRRGWIGGLHSVFGRLPIVYPNLFLPTWQIEGLAVFEESARTGMGRIPAGDFRQILETGAAARRFDPLDRVNGGLIDWPGGMAPYLYGGYFQQYVVSRYGEASLRELTDETARRVPYLGTRAYKKVFGRTLGSLWSDFKKDVSAKLVDETDRTRQVTHHGFTVAAPRFGRDGRVYYLAANPHGFPALMELPAGGSRPGRLTSRYLGNRTGIGRSVVIFDQLELVNSVALQSDLYAVGLENGRVWRVTRNARAGDPDLSPDERTIVCTVQRADRRELGTLPFSAAARDSQMPSTLLSQEGIDYSAPRWSPDGRWIAAERRRAGAASEVVLVDPRTRGVRVIAAAAGHRSVTPAWTPDGAWVLFASDRDGGPFRIFRVALDGGAVERLDGTGNHGADSPDISADGSALVFVGYTADGRDLFRMDLRAARWTRVGTDVTNLDASIRESQSQSPDSPAPGHPYSPWRTLAPRFWTPVAATDNGELVVGGATAAADVLGRHTYAADIGWSASRARPDWHVAYAYDRWRPTLFADFSDDTDPFGAGEIRTREANAGLLLPFRRVRWSETLLGAFNASTDEVDCPLCTPPLVDHVARRSLRAGWSLTTAKSYGYSISAEDGVRMTAAAELTRRALGADGDAGSATLDARAYRTLFPRHGVLAARFGAATAWGDPRVRRVFAAAGAGPAQAGFAFGSDAVALLRGFSEDRVLGRHAIVGNLDYRLPLSYVQRGIGTVPVFLRVVHAAVFLDAAQAWTGGAFRTSDLRASAGGELSFDTVIGYGLPLTLTGGMAWRHDGTGREKGFTVFGRIGRAF